MHVILGTTNYGKVDVAPKLFYVATRFFHVYYAPLIPLGSYVIRTGSEEGEKFDGVKIALSWKSVLAAWVRTVLVICMIAGAIMALVMAFEALDGFKRRNLGDAVPPLALSLMSVIAFWLTKVTSRASHGRAYELAEMLGVPAEEVDRQLGVLPYLHEAETANDYSAESWSVERNK